MTTYTPEELAQLRQMYEDAGCYQMVAVLERGNVPDYYFRYPPKAPLTSRQLQDLWSREKALYKIELAFFDRRSDVTTIHKSYVVISLSFLRQVMFEYPLRELPKLINHPIMGTIARWRFMLGK